VFFLCHISLGPRPVSFCIALPPPLFDLNGCLFRWLVKFFSDDLDVLLACDFKLFQSFAPSLKDDYPRRPSSFRREKTEASCRLECSSYGLFPPSPLMAGIKGVESNAILFANSPFRVFCGVFIQFPSGDFLTTTPTDWSKPSLRFKPPRVDSLLSSLRFFQTPSLATQQRGSVS